MDQLNLGFSITRYAVDITPVGLAEVIKFHLSSLRGRAGSSPSLTVIFIAPQPASLLAWDSIGHFQTWIYSSVSSPCRRRQREQSKSDTLVFIIVLLHCQRRSFRLSCISESWSHVLSLRPHLHCQFTWWGKLLRIYLCCQIYSNTVVCLWHCDPFFLVYITQ